MTTITLSKEAFGKFSDKVFNNEIFKYVLLPFIVMQALFAVVPSWDPYIMLIIVAASAFGCGMLLFKGLFDYEFSRIGLALLVVGLNGWYQLATVTHFTETSSTVVVNNQTNEVLHIGDENSSGNIVFINDINSFTIYEYNQQTSFVITQSTGAFSSKENIPAYEISYNTTIDVHYLLNNIENIDTLAAQMQEIIQQDIEGNVNSYITLSDEDFQTMAKSIRDGDVSKDALERLKNDIQEQIEDEATGRACKLIEDAGYLTAKGTCAMTINGFSISKT